ncbi:MAG: PASTA domain-containing protein [Clostridia bacterium]|nr:PASTA domain-containing protein [Clostridia bacterium]
MENQENKKKLFKTIIIATVVVFTLILVPIILAVVTSDKIIEVPYVEGKTLEEAEKELAKAGFKYQVMYNDSESKDAIVTSQFPKSSTKKGNTIELTTKTQEQIKKEEEAQEQRNKESITRSKTVVNFVKIIEAKHQGSVKYHTNTPYATSKTGESVYKLKYTTSNENIYYYQLVSFNEDYTQILKSTNLFEFCDYGNGETGLTQEMEYAFEQTFGGRRK